MNALPKVLMNNRGKLGHESSALACREGAPQESMQAPELPPEAHLCICRKGERRLVPTSIEWCGASQRRDKSELQSQAHRGCRPYDEKHRRKIFPLRSLRQLSEANSGTGDTILRTAVVARQGSAGGGNKPSVINGLKPSTDYAD